MTKLQEHPKPKDHILDQDEPIKPKRSGRAFAISVLVILILFFALMWSNDGLLSTPIKNWIDASSDTEDDTKNRSQPQLTTEQQALLTLTEGELATIVEIGDAAEKANSALPFSNAPVVAASGFSLAQANNNHGRAKQCLTQAIYHEAGFESVVGMRAVAQVVINRMRHPAFPSSICGVVYQGHRARVCQFSFTCDGALHRKAQPAAWNTARRIAGEALSGSVAKNVGLATHYHANYVSPYWAPKLTKIRKIGAHIFYRWPGQWGQKTAFASRYGGGEFIPSLASLPKTPAGAFEGRYENGLVVPPDKADRHAKADVGGRLDVTKGWTLKIPDPKETRSAFEQLTTKQAQVDAVQETAIEGGE